MCAASDVGRLITAAQDRGWDAGVIATPQGLEFLDTRAIEIQTGYPVRSAWRSPGEPRTYPRADAIAVAPVTFKTVNKWACESSRYSPGGSSRNFPGADLGRRLRSTA